VFLNLLGTQHNEVMVFYSLGNKLSVNDTITINKDMDFYSDGSVILKTDLHALVLRIQVKITKKFIYI